jgi:hypothetical protein
MVVGTVDTGGDRLDRPGVLKGESSMPPSYRHEFVETWGGMIAFGYSREDDERSLIALLQKFSDDDLMQLLSRRLTDQEIDTLVNLLIGLLKNHLSHGEYHCYFLKAGAGPDLESRSEGD